MIWTDREQSELERLAAEGLSARAIGQKLGFTRNAIIGRSRRTRVKLAGPKWRGTLSPGDVADIRTGLAEGFTQSFLAAKFGVTQPTISAIKTGRAWGGAA